MRITSDTVADGIREQLFSVGGIPGVLWAPAEGSGPRPLVLTGHGGGQQKKEPGVLSRAFPYITTCGFAVASIDAPGAGFVMQWDDAGHPRDPVQTLSGALGSAGKTLHASPVSHLEVPDFGIGSSIRFFARHLDSQGAAI